MSAVIVEVFLQKTFNHDLHLHGIEIHLSKNIFKSNFTGFQRTCDLNIATNVKECKAKLWTFDKFRS